MIKHYSIKFFLVLVIIFSSCSPYHNSVYFQGLDRNSAINHKIDNYAPLTTIQIGDMLAIGVKSLNPDGSAIFNAGNIDPQSTSTGNSDSNAPSGYLVDQNGEIQFPLIHNVKVVGLTVVEIQNNLQKATLPFLKEPMITVRLTNFKVTVLGDVSRPNIYSVNSEHISIPQVLSLAGDISITGKRDNILLIREINGERKFVNIDVTSDKLFDSPFYYLKNNDILYVEAGRSKFSNLSPVRQTLPLVISIISLILFVYELTRIK